MIFRRVEQYAEMMKRGDWLPTDQGIGINTKGQAINGQHRLNAIIKADKPITMLVVRGLMDRALLVTDQGAKRTAHDQIKLREGFEVQPIHIAVAKSMITSVGGIGDKARGKITTDIQLLDRFYVRHRTAIEFAVRNFWTGHNTVKGVTIAPVFAPVARAYYTQDRELLQRFTQVVSTGFSESADESAAIVLRNYLIAGRDKGLSARSYGDRYHIYKKTEVALKAFLKGERIQRLGHHVLEAELFLLPEEKGRENGSK